MRDDARLDLLQDQESTSMDHGEKLNMCLTLHMLLQQLLPQTDMEVNLISLSSLIPKVHTLTQTSLQHSFCLSPSYLEK